MFTTRPEIRGRFGVCASTHWLASSVGMRMLELGGNAFDAAVAMGFTLQVVEPHLNGPGGDLPILFWDARSRKVNGLSAQGSAPRGASIAHYRAQGLDRVPGTGLLATVIPGAFDGWMQLLRDYGSLPLDVVLEPAIDYAANGYPLMPQIIDTIERIAPHFRAHWVDSAALYLPGGQPPRIDHLFRNPSLAETWRRLLREAASAGSSREAQIEQARYCWRQGFIAEAIDHYCRTQWVMDTSGNRHQAILTGEDLAGWQAHYETPIESSYRDWRVVKFGPWCQGPVLLQTLNILEGYNIASMDPQGPDFVHIIVETMKLAFADREAWYGDPKFTDVPLDGLLSKDYAEKRRRLISDTASLDLRPGAPDGRIPRMPHHAIDVTNAAGAGEPTMQMDRAPPIGEARGDTCHIDVIDRWGNMVSATPSGGWLQSSPVIPELGFCLNSRAQMFWLEEGLPATLAPGKRPRSTLTPSLAFKGDDVAMAFGTPGGDQQDQWQALMLLHIVDQGDNLQLAIDRPAFHTDHMPSSFWPRAAQPNRLTLESRFPPETIAELKRRGHDVIVGGPWSEGRLSVTARWGADADYVLKAAANPRGMQGYAVGR